MIYPFSGAFLENKENLITSDYKGNISLFNLGDMLELINLENSKKLFLPKKKINLNSLILQMDKIDNFLFIRIMDKINIYLFDDFLNYLKNGNSKTNKKLEIYNTILTNEQNSELIQLENSIIFLKRKNSLNIYNIKKKEENIFFESEFEIISFFKKEKKIYILLKNYQLLKLDSQKKIKSKINLKNIFQENNLNDLNIKKTKIKISNNTEDTIFIINENLIIKYNFFLNQILLINSFPSFIIDFKEIEISENFKYLISLNNSMLIKLDENLKIICDLKNSNFESKIFFVEEVLGSTVFVSGGSDGVLDVYKNSMNVFCLVNDDN